MTIAADRLRSYIERIEKLEEEKKAIAADIKDIYTEAKAAGFTPKVMREIIKLRAQDAADREEHEMLLDTYKHALGMLADTPLGEAAKPRKPSHGRTYNRALDAAKAVAAENDSKVVAALREAVAHAKGELPAHDAETGEITESPDAAPRGQRAAPSEPSEDDAAASGVHLRGESSQSTAGAEAAAMVPPVSAPAAGLSAGPTVSAEEPDLTIPGFLRRRRPT